MIGSTGRRWKHICIAGAGLACLGAGTMLISGCSTTTISDTRTSAQSDRQVAGTKGSAPGKSTTAAKAKPPAKKSAQQVAKKTTPGKARISDLDNESRVQMAARAGQDKAATGATAKDGTKTALATPPATVANRAAKTPASSSSQRQVARGTGATNAPQPQRPAATNATPRTTVAANSRTPAGAIKQTSGDVQPSSGASPRTATTAAVRPVITPRKSEWQPENGGEAVGSIHERRRADRLMQRAYTMYENGYREEALRLASVAAELEYSQQAIYKRGEERPSDFVEFLLTASGKSNWSRTIETTPQSSGRRSETSGTSTSKVPATARDSATGRSCSQNERKNHGEVFPVEATSLPQAPRDLKAANPATPRFTTDEKENLQATANVGQITVPLAKSTRKADVSVVTADGSGTQIDPPSKIADSPSVVTADRVEEADEPSTTPKVLVTKAPAPAPATPEAEIEPLAEADAPAATASHSTSQLTIASLVGLLTGIAGMLGLGWWRRQERRHYAAGK